MTKAWDLIGFDGGTADKPAHVRIRGGRALYEAVIFYDGTRQEKVKLSRLEATPDGIRQVDRRVDPDTEMEILFDDGKVWEPTPEEYWAWVDAEGY